MRNVRVDDEGVLRCWNCGSTGFTEKRTARSKWLTLILGVLTVGIWLIVMALLTKKKLKCQVCGEYNDVGNAQPWDGPHGRKYREQWEAQQPPPPAP